MSAVAAIGALRENPESWGTTPVFAYGFDDFTPLLSYELQQKNWARELTRGWGYEYAMRFESQSLTLQEMEHTIYKNWKKCIDTAIMYRLRDDDHTIMATFWLTAYPGSKIDMGM